MWAYCSTHGACSEVCICSCCHLTKNILGHFYPVCVCVHTTKRNQVDGEHWSIPFNSFPSFYHRIFDSSSTQKCRTLNADEHALVILSSKTALLWLLSFFFLKHWSVLLLCTCSGALQAVLCGMTACRVKGHEGQISVLNSQCSYASPVSCKAPCIYMQLFCISCCVLGEMWHRLCWCAAIHISTAECKYGGWAFAFPTGGLCSHLISCSLVFLEIW